RGGLTGLGAVETAVILEDLPGGGRIEKVCQRLDFSGFGRRKVFEKGGKRSCKAQAPGRDHARPHGTPCWRVKRGPDRRLVRIEAGKGVPRTSDDIPGVVGCYGRADQRVEPRPEGGQQVVLRRDMTEDGASLDASLRGDGVHADLVGSGLRAHQTIKSMKDSLARFAGFLFSQRAVVAARLSHVCLR